MKITSVIAPYALALEENGMNLVAYLAEHGQDEYVEELISLGAAIDDAIYGYAMAGKKLIVTSLLAECPDAKKKVSVGMAIRGYARAGDIGCVHGFSDYIDYIADFVIGRAQAGDAATVTAILDRRIELFAQAVQGYASCNHVELLTRLIKGTSYYPLAIFHAACSGHLSLVNQLLLDCGIAADYQVAPALAGVGDAAASVMDISVYSLLNHALKGYMTGRHFTEAVALLVRGASISQAVSALVNEQGLPNHELYLAFLSHMQDATFRAKVVRNLSARIQVMEPLTITHPDIERLEKILQVMTDSRLNYLEACSQLDDKSSSETVGEISLAYLAKCMGAKLDVKSDSEKSPIFP